MGISAFFSMWNLLGVMVLHRSMVNCRRRMGQNWCGVVVFHRSMVYWSMGAICPWYMYILLYMKLMWCSGIPKMYGQLEEGGGQNVCGVVLLYRSMVDWRGQLIWGYTWFANMTMSWWPYVVLLFATTCVYRRGDRSSEKII